MTAKVDGVKKISTIGLSFLGACALSATLSTAPAAHADASSDFRDAIVNKINAALVAGGSSTLQLPVSNPWAGTTICTTPLINNSVDAAAWAGYRDARLATNQALSPWNAGLYAEMSHVNLFAFESSTYNAARTEYTRKIVVNKQSMPGASLIDATPTLGALYAESEGPATSYLAMRAWEDTNNFYLAVVSH
ncbi:MAG: hypothetical protein Q3972_02575 [Corynebacterium sp.]|nr:hypothetical protein [Corynebacterium sp.]